MPKGTKASATHLLSNLAAFSLSTGSRRAKSVGRAVGLHGSSIDALVHASDVATKLLQGASLEVRSRAARERDGDRRLPSLLANSHAGIVQAVLGDERLRYRVTELEEEVTVTISPRTRGGIRLRDMRGRMQEVALHDAKPDESHLVDAVDFLLSEGMSIVRVGRFGITASGPAQLVQDLLSVSLGIGAARRPVIDRALRLFSIQGQSPEPADLFAAPRESLSIAGSRIHASIDDFTFTPPARPSIADRPPAVGYPVLQDAEVRRALGHDGSLDGHGVKVAIIDSGFFRQHPLFMRRPYDFESVDSGADETGHGTAMAWNILNVAPGCTLRGYRQDDIAGAIERAADDGAKIISCSWGWPDEQSFNLLELSIRSVIEEDGATVLCAAGNGERYWPASHPRVVAVGGVYANPQDGSLEASDFASGFRSDLYGNRNVPDVSGLCGLSPRGVYLPLPVPPGSIADVARHGPAFPEADETEADDGWIYDSGTSSATAQVAGVVALLMQYASAHGKTMTPDRIKSCLQAGAVAVERGRNAFGVPAVGQPNIATGWGLVNVKAALKEIDKL
ncbi:hypothetical protein CS062_05175 [Roseateles chitinivorans]|uniref:Peptidase S8/S53 domain-containing protein n=1 Tax=Roseateles chitinivorans TaxID=2917965 RepID=A0A2G9CCY4_9BURK|nr:S8 family serine peptidase [Roseateles chitinivorans]PIM54300.1 hypothetical protein CS062_05175 [Roseateles chitinivorans]